MIKYWGEDKYDLFGFDFEARDERSWGVGWWRGVFLVGLYRNVRVIDLNLSVGITNPRRLNLIFIPSVTVKHYILYNFTLIFIYIFYK